MIMQGKLIMLLLLFEETGKSGYAVNSHCRGSGSGRAAVPDPEAWTSWETGSRGAWRLLEPPEPALQFVRVSLGMASE